MGDGAGPDGCFGNRIKLPIVGKARLAERQPYDLGDLHEASARLLHWYAKSIIFNGTGAAAEPEHSTPASHYVEQSDLFGDPHRVMPGEDDHRCAQLDTPCPACKVR